MKKVKKTIAYLVAILLGILALVCCFAKARSPRLYEAHGIFYYGFYGMEMETPSMQDCCGPRSFDLFMDVFWDKRPADFEQRVLHKLHDSHGRNGDDEAVLEAIKTISFHAVPMSYYRIRLTVIASDSSLAVDVANASMEVLADLDLEGAEEKREKAIAQFVGGYEQARKNEVALAKRMASAKSERERHAAEKGVAQWARLMENINEKISLYREMDSRTNTMFKIMVPARVATNVDGRKTGEIK